MIRRSCSCSMWLSVFSILVVFSMSSCSSCIDSVLSRSVFSESFLALSRSSWSFFRLVLVSALYRSFMDWSLSFSDFLLAWSSFFLRSPLTCRILSLRSISLALSLWVRSSSSLLLRFLSVCWLCLLSMVLVGRLCFFRISTICRSAVSVILFSPFCRSLSLLAVRLWWLRML